MEFEKKAFIKNWYSRLSLSTHDKNYLICSILDMLSKEFFNWSKFSRFERKIIDAIKIKVKKTGIAVITDKDWKVKKRYTNKKIKDLIKTVVLKTAIIDKECFIRLKKLILDGPKYLDPLIDGTETRLPTSLDNDPEKLLQVEAFFAIWITAVLGKQV